jgi:hypothetical protein
MVEAINTLPRYPSHVIITLARQAAKSAVKQQLRAQGLKPQMMRASGINATANLYFVANWRALLEEAWRKCQRRPDLMRFHEKAEKDRAKRIASLRDSVEGVEASFKSLGDPWADTTTPHGRLMLTVLGGLAEFERHLIFSRTAEGRVRAKGSRDQVRSEA